MTHASTSLRTLYGDLRSVWRFSDGRFEWTVQVPPNTPATAHVPNADVKAITLNGAEHGLPTGEHTFAVT